MILYKCTAVEPGCVICIKIVGRALEFEGRYPKAWNFLSNSDSGRRLQPMPCSSSLLFRGPAIPTAPSCLRRYNVPAPVVNRRAMAPIGIVTLLRATALQLCALGAVAPRLYCLSEIAKSQAYEHS